MRFACDDTAEPRRTRVPVAVLAVEMADDGAWAAGVRWLRWEDDVDEEMVAVV